MAHRDRKRLPLSPILAFAAVVATGTVGVLRARGPSDTLVSCPADGPRANLSFALPDANGQPVNLASLAGHVVLLDFWATWCGPCRIEMPALADVYTRDHARGLEVIGVAVQDDFRRAAAFADQMHVPYPVLDGTRDRRLADAFGVATDLPTSIVIGRQGQICARHVGLPPFAGKTTDLRASTRAFLVAEIDALLEPRR